MEQIQKQKFTITGVEKVMDVIEAVDYESAEKLFRAKYPAVYAIIPDGRICPCGKKAKHTIELCDKCYEYVIW